MPRHPVLAIVFSGLLLLHQSRPPRQRDTRNPTPTICSALVIGGADRLANSGRPAATSIVMPALVAGI